MSAVRGLRSQYVEMQEQLKSIDLSDSKEMSAELRGKIKRVAAVINNTIAGNPKLDRTIKDAVYDLYFVVKTESVDVDQVKSHLANAIDRTEAAIRNCGREDNPMNNLDTRGRGNYGSFGETPRKSG